MTEALRTFTAMLTGALGLVLLLGWMANPESPHLFPLSLVLWVLIAAVAVMEDPREGVG